MQGQSEATRGKAAGVLDSVRRIISPKSADALGANQISQYVKALREAGRSEATIKGHLAYIKAALRWATSMQIIPKAPTIKMPSRVKTAKGRAVTMEEFQKILKAVPIVLNEPASCSRVQSWEFFLRGLYLVGPEKLVSPREYWGGVMILVG